MGVYIEGMEMPKNCSTCPFCFGANNICPWVMEYATCKGRHKDCPLVPVPPHGRLIDADALKLYMLNEYYKYRLVYDADEVANAPTIIPAEGGET